MEQIYTVDGHLNKLFEQFEKIASSIPFIPVGNLLNADLVEQQTYSGVYFIEVNTGTTPIGTLEQWLTQFCEEWLDEMYENQFVPSPKKQRIKVHLAHGELKEWMPLYIGKSKHINRRLWEHVYLPLAKKTFALKLNERPTMISRNWRFSTINLDGVKNYDVIAPKIEYAMRKKYHPIVGKQ